MSEPATDLPSTAGGPAPARRFRVDGLCCASEARLIETRLGASPGVRRLRIDPVHHRLDVEGDVAPDDVRRIVGELGMRAELLDPAPGAAGTPPAAPARLSPRTALAAASGGLFALALSADHLLGAPAVALALAVASVAAGGWYVFPRAWRAGRSGALDMNVLMSLAAVGALLIGEHAEAASVMFLFAVAQLLETASLDRARRAIRGLMELAPPQATVLRGGREVRVGAEEVAVGETVLVRPGEKVAVDGVVAAGLSAVDQAPVTGESVPVEKAPGDEVFAGTLNGEGALEVRSTRPASDTTLARIIHAVEEAQATRAPSQTFVDRFARGYTPVVVALAAALAVLPPLAGLGTWGEWVYRALALLVVACPCALVISTPVTVVSALAGGARQGILVKGGRFLESAGRAGVVALDKTGTLTSGRPEVAAVVALDGSTPGRVLALAAAAESRSEHPLAAAIRRAAEVQGPLPRGTGPAAARDTRAFPGRGVAATVEGRRVVVGSGRLFRELGVAEAAVADALRRAGTAGRTVVLVGEADGGDGDAPPHLLGAVALADRVRPDAAAALAALRRAGIGRIVMLTGDDETTAAAVAAGLGGAVDDVRAGLLPADKAAAVRQMEADWGAVLMVGDGINDAPALAAASVGVAMGVAGTDVALETADVALMSDELSRLPVLVRLARKAEGIVRANIAFALGVKAVFVVLAAAGVATLWMAVLADMGASLLVIGNGLRALRA